VLVVSAAATAVAPGVAAVVTVAAAVRTSASRVVATTAPAPPPASAATDMRIRAAGLEVMADRLRLPAGVPARGTWEPLGARAYEHFGIP
jgi:hypothetical protein